MTQDRRRKGAEKQSERLEVRLSASLRDQFLLACKRAGQTPSDVLRAAMSDYVEKVELAERKTLHQELTMKLIHNPLKAASMALASLTAFALLAAPSSADEKLFKTLDSNGDGVLTEKDTAPLEKVILILDEDGSDSITLDEFRTMARYGHLFDASQVNGKIELQAKRLVIDDNTNEAVFSGDVDRIWTPGNDASRIPSPQNIIGSLVTIDLTTPGEVRFKTEEMTMRELVDIGELDRLVIQIDSGLLDQIEEQASAPKTP